MSEPTNPLEEAFERAMAAFVYAPIGLVFDGPDPFPDLVEKGRNQVTAAKMMGEFAVQLGQTEACKLLDQRRSQLLETLGGSQTPPSKAPAPAAPKKAAPTAPVAEKRPAAPKPDLAIPEYDGLSASQVVTRLGGLSQAELEAVRQHEAASRGRKTILNKVAQLQA